jgi:hypothetical protein
MNYAQLSAAIKSYCENEFPQTVGSVTSIQQINYFIEQAEQRIYNSVQFPSLKKNTTGSVTANNPYVSAPDDFLAVYSMAVIDNVTGNYEYLLNKDANFIREAYPSPTSTGKPKFYALFGPATTNDAPPVITTEWSFILGPTPNLAYTLELHYYYYAESIVTAGTTWLGDNVDSVLLYGALLEAATFMKTDADTLANYQKRYDEALAMAKRLGDGMGRQDAYRSGQVRVKVT